MAGINIILLIFLSILKLSLAQNTLCGQTKSLGLTGTAQISWPEANNNNVWCGYVFLSPPDTYIKATITMSLKGTEPSCSANQYLAVSIDNMPNWDGYSTFCGNKTGLVISSIGNELKLGINADDKTQRVQIQIQVIRLQTGDCQCSWNPTMRIINGQNAGANTFTSHVTFNAQSSNFCGGFLVTQYHAITAAHCVVNINNVYGISNVKMFVGRYNIRNSLTSDTVYSEAYNLIKAITHASYNNPQNDNDIGVVTTSKYVRFTRGVAPACLPFAYLNFNLADGTTVVAVGFGSTEFSLDENYDTKSWTLQRVNLVSNSKLASDCSGNYFCANGTLSGGFRGDTCTRDSGGGVYGYMKSRYYAFGVISRGLSCGSSNSFSYNIYVPKYISWIQSKIDGNFTCNY